MNYLVSNARTVTMLKRLFTTRFPNFEGTFIVASNTTDLSMEKIREYLAEQEIYVELQRGLTLQNVKDMLHCEDLRTDDHMTTKELMEGGDVAFETLDYYKLIKTKYCKTHPIERWETMKVEEVMDEIGLDYFQSILKATVVFDNNRNIGATGGFSDDVALCFSGTPKTRRQRRDAEVAVMLERLQELDRQRGGYRHHRNYQTALMKLPLNLVGDHLVEEEEREVNDMSIEEAVEVEEEVVTKELLDSLADTFEELEDLELDEPHYIGHKDIV
jgi:hypothetical protein